jgi:hypothetical protein
LPVVELNHFILDLRWSDPNICNNLSKILYK